MPSDSFRELVASAHTIKDILRGCELLGKGGNYKTVKQRLVEENIDFSHIRLGEGHNKGRNYGGGIKKRELADVLIENSTYSRHVLKSRLLKEKLLNNSCYICNIKPFWNNNPLVLVLDHINGVGDDNRLGNLRLLCPNCHSQTDTFAGKNIKTRRKALVEKSDKLTKASWIRRRKVVRPKINEILEEIEKTNYERAAKKFGVSSTAMRKWIKVFNKYGELD